MPVMITNDEEKEEIKSYFKNSNSGAFNNSTMRAFVDIIL